MSTKTQIRQHSAERLAEINAADVADTIATAITEWGYTDAAAADFAEMYEIADLTDLAHYSLSIDHTRRTRDGISWDGTIYRDGTPVICVEQDGHGGSNVYHPYPQSERGEIPMLREICERAFPKMRFEQIDRAMALLDMANCTI